MKLQLVISFILGAALLMLVATPVSAGMYDGVSPTQGLIIDKTVSFGASATNGLTYYVDNYSAVDPRFQPGQKVYFQIKVRNTANARLTNIMVKDYLPAYLDPVDGPGTFDGASRAITYTIPALEAGQEDTQYFTMQIKSQTALPADRGMICMTNRAVASTSDVSDDDTAQFCVEKQVVGVTKAPAAGPEFGLALAGLQFAGLAAGLYLKKRTS